MDRILRVLPTGIIVAVAALALAAGPDQKLPAAEAALSPGPALTAPLQPLARLPSVGSPAAESLTEMPIAEATPLTSETNRAEVSRGAAAAKTSPPATAGTVHERSSELEQVAQQADRQTRHGFELAGRGAHFAARAEFIGALRLVAEGLDTEQKTGVHSRALAAALTAMKEAEDFLPGGSRLEADLELSGMIAAHATPVLKNDTEQGTPLTALRRYLTFAQEQFAVAADHEVAGSMALHGLGKLHAAWAQKKGAKMVAPESKALVFYQAALLVYPKNFMAANDLGVLLAQCGRWADARTMLERSASLCPQSTNWQNLAAVYRQLGQTALADRAAGQATRCRQMELARRKTSPTGANDLVLWVDPQTFAQTSTNTPNAPGATPTPPARAGGLPAEAIHVRPMARSAAATNWSAPPSWPTTETNRAAPTAGPAPQGYPPAPTPAAAQRMSWGAGAY